MNTEAFQSQLADVINGQHCQFDASDLLGPAPLEQLIQVYKNNYRVSLTEYLEAVFPATLALVGEEFFALLAKRYIDGNPPSVPQLDGYGKQFPTMIMETKEAESVPYLADVAQLEWRLDRLGNQRYQQYEAFPFQQLQTLNAEDQSHIHFTLSKNIQWQTFDFPALGIWQGVQSGDLEDINLDNAEPVLFHLQPDYSVAMEIVTADALALLAAFDSGKSIAEVMAIPEAANAVGQYLEAWIQQGIIINFTCQMKELP